METEGVKIKESVWQQNLSKMTAYSTNSTLLVLHSTNFLMLHSTNFLIKMKLMYVFSGLQYSAFKNRLVVNSPFYSL
jgi:hypothetical protein